MNNDQASGYVTWDEADQRTQIAENQVFYFELALIGEIAIRQVPAFVAAMMVAGEQGIGRGQRQFKARLAQVTVLNSASESACALMTDGLWREGLIENLSLGYSNGEEWSASKFPLADGPATQLHIWFRSPTRLEAQGKVVSEPRFSTLWQAVVRRLRVLSQLYGAGDLPLSEYQPLLTIANQVQLDRHETTWIGSAQQHSPDTAEAENGFMGHAWYSAPLDLRPLLPILWLGQWVHVGTGAAYGSGRYQVEVCT